MIFPFIAIFVPAKSYWVATIRDTCMFVYYTLKCLMRDILSNISFLQNADFLPVLNYSRDQEEYRAC